MPRGDGTGPMGGGTGTGRGMGGGGGMGRGRGRGRMGGRAFGAGGACVCPSCGKKVPHQRGLPCTQRTCPHCGAMMARELPA